MDKATTTATNPPAQPGGDEGELLARAPEIVRELLSRTRQDPNSASSAWLRRAADFIEQQSDLITKLLSDREAVRKERDALQRDLLTVQNAAKNIAGAQGTELEHLRQNRTFDHKLRTEHESLIERDAQMTDALLAAEKARDEAAKGWMDAEVRLGNLIDQSKEDWRKHGATEIALGQAKARIEAAETELSILKGKVGELEGALREAREWVELGPDLPGVSAVDEAEARDLLTRIDTLTSGGSGS